MSWLRGAAESTEGFDALDEFVPEHVPEPGPFLADHDVLVDEAHVAVHRESRDRFEEYGVYDVTFGYNLARLNLDRRHPDAGLRYAEDGDALRVEFTPTTEFCPQGGTLARGVFRAWNGDDGGDYRIVTVRIAEGHQNSASINESLQELEEQYAETGALTLDEGE